MKPLSLKPLPRTTLCCLALILPTLTAQPVAAQKQQVGVAKPAAVEKEEVAVDPVEKAEQDAAEFKKRIENRVIEEFRIAAQSKLLLETEELERVCDLDAKATKKLEIAAKGAAERYIRNQEQRLRGHVRLDRWGADTEIRVAGKKVPRPGEPEEEPEPEPEPKPREPEKKPEPKPPVLQAIGRLFGVPPAPRPAFRPQVQDENVANITVAVQRYGMQYRVKHRGGSSSSGFGGGIEELKREAVWVQTINAVVTLEQKQKYELAIEARRQRLRDAAIVYAMGQVDLELRLTEQQYSQLRELFETRVVIGNVNPTSVRYTAERQIKETDADLLKPILSDAQLKVWGEYAAW
jgi:hypothetical protein